MRKLIFLIVFSASQWGIAAEVTALGADPTVVTIALDPYHEWKPHEQVCVFHDGKMRACGLVVQVTNTSAVVRLSSKSNPVQKGDEARATEKRAIASVAQPNESSFGWGPLVGLSAATMNVGSTNLEYSERTGLLAGIHLNLPLGGMFSLAPEVFYAQKGGVVHSRSYVVDTYNYNYLEVPLAVKASWQMGSFSPFLEVAPYAAMVLSAKVFSETTQGTAVTSTEVDNKKNIKSLDYGVGFGVGAQMALGQATSLIFSCRYGLGLAKLDTQTVVSPTRLRSTEFLVALLFR